jgi:hypothetical protein
VLSKIRLEIKMRKDRLIVGILCLAFAAWTFLADTANSATAPAIGIGILGIITIAISRRR